jgi:hypothetical protein
LRVIIVGKVPRRDRGADPDRLADDGDALVGLVAGNGLAVDPLGLFGEPLDEGGAVQDLAPGLGQRLALLGGQDGGQVIGIGDHQVVPFPQDIGALLGGARRPVLHRRRPGGNRARGLGPAQIGNPRHNVAARRVGHIEGPPAFAIHPLAAKIPPRHKKRRIAKQG